MNWALLKENFNNILDEVRNEEFDNISNLKDEFINFFDKKQYTKEEFQEAKELVAILNIEIQKKIDFYSEQMDTRVKEIKNAQIYASNMKIMDFE